MVVQVSCGKCKQIVRAEEQFFGKTVKCPGCQTGVAIPDPSANQARTKATEPSIGKWSRLLPAGGVFLASALFFLGSINHILKKNYFFCQGKIIF